jgi:parvulin-like peptidyl-prolyl isomerase
MKSVARYRPGSTLVIALLLGVIAGACRSEERSAVIATINGIEIRKHDFDGFLSLKMGELTSAETADSIRSQMLDDYIRRRLVLAEAARARLAVTDAELEQAALQNPQIKSSTSSEAARKELINDLLIAKYYNQIILKDVRPSTEEVQHYLEANRARLTDRPSFYVREIRVDSQERAQKLLTAVTEERQDFAEVARLHSQAPSAEQGGLLRFTQGHLPSVLEKAIARLNPGEISPVIQSSYGFHVFKLERRVPVQAHDERRSQLDERRSALIEELIGRKNEEAVEAAVARLVSSSSIQIVPSSLGFTYSGKLGHN